MDTDERSYRPVNPASRPPVSDSGEDTPLFTEIPYTSPRRTQSSGRPSYSAPSAAPDRSAERSSPYGGRPYSQSRSSAAPPQGRERNAQNRAAPVYTELSWDDLRRGTDFSSSGRPAESVAPNQPPQEQKRRTATPYFGGFEQERDSLFSKNQPYHTPEREETRRQIRYVAPTRPAARQQRTAAARTRQNPESAPRRSAPPVPPSGTPANRYQPSGGSRRPSRPRRGRNIPPIYLMGGFVLLALIIFGISKLAGTKSNSNAIRPGNPISVTTAAPSDALPTDELIAAETTPEATPDATATPTPEPSPTPSGPKAQQLGDLIVPADWGPVVPERRRAVYDSYFDKSCMIGNSLADGFFMYAGMTNIRYIKEPSITVNNAIGRLDFAPLTLNANDYYTDIYLVFGLNEIGWDINSFVQGYKILVDFIREHQTKANIYIVSVTPITKMADDDPNVPQTMERVKDFNSALKEFCEDQNCWFLDIYSMLLDNNGYLSEDYAYLGDGMHFEKSGYVAWANYMKTHYVDDGLLTE